MKRIAVFALLALVLPASAFAHETHVFEINGENYQFVVGSLNEPIVVDDKTGVSLSVSMVGHEAMEATDHHAAGGAVAGLEESLKVELIAGDKKKTLDLSPVYNTPGSYKAPFYPTVATTLSYRVFGTINDTPVDLTFSCSPAGHTVAEEDKNRVQISDKVFRVSKTGSYGCPTEKAEMGFPEESASVADLESSTSQGMWGIGFGVLGIALAGFALMRKS
ncbi:hypothetical protein K2P56_04760 [Patescibacteria group bacterium]|nr:hypothetical protein [Patescibacteria group bacterium]